MPKEKSKRGTHPENYNQYWGFAVIFVMLGMAFLGYVPISEVNLGLAYLLQNAPSFLYFLIPQAVLVVFVVWDKTPLWQSLLLAVVVWAALWLFRFPIFMLVLFTNTIWNSVTLWVLVLIVLGLFLYSRVKGIVIPYRIMSALVLIYAFVCLSSLVFVDMQSDSFRISNRVFLNGSAFFIVLPKVTDSFYEADYLARCNSLGLNCEPVMELNSGSRYAWNLDVEGDTLQILDWDGNILAEYKP